MDDRIDLSSLASSDSAIGDAVSKLLSRPDILMNVANELGLAGASPKERSDVGETAKDTSSASENTDTGLKLPQPKPTDGGDDKKKLLYALRPYMSPKRREALDMMINLESIGKLIGNIDPQTIMKLLGGGKNV